MSKYLRISHLDDIEMHKATTEELLILSRAARNFMKNKERPASFHTSALYTDAKMFLGKLRAVLVNHHTNSAPKFAAFLTQQYPIRVRHEFLSCRASSPVFLCAAMTHCTEKSLDGSDRVSSAAEYTKGQNVFPESDPVQKRRAGNWKAYWSNFKYY